MPQTKKLLAACGHCPGHVHPCRCLRFGKQATAPSPPSRTHRPCRGLHGQNSHIHPCRCLHGQKKNRSTSSVTVSLIVEETVQKQRSAPGSAALELQRSSAGAPATFNSFGSPLQATLSFPPSNRNQIACLTTEISTVHTPKSHMSCESSKARLSRASHRRRPAT